MPRTFKISFPLPGRRPSGSPSTTPGSQLSGSYGEHDDSPRYYPSPKVQEVLGAATPDPVTPSTSSKRQSRKDRKSPFKFPSFMSVTLADLDENGSANAEEGFPFPGMQTPSVISTNIASQPSRPPSHVISRHGSSPLLGQAPAIGSTTSQTDYFGANGAGPRPGPRQATSLSNLRSYHDQAEPLLSVPQRTMYTIPRDIVSESAGSQITRSFTTTHDSERTHSRNQSGASKESNGSNASARTKIAGTPRRRPSVNDPPTLYPNAPRPLTHAVTPPPALINASLPRSMQTGQAPPLSFGRARWWDRRKPKMSPPVEMPEKFEHIPFEDGIMSAKVNVKKPKKGISHWFDALETEESSLSNFSEQGNVSQQAHEQEAPRTQYMEGPMLPPEIREQTLRPAPAISSRKSSFSTKSKRPGQADRKLSFKLESPSPPKFQQSSELEQLKKFKRTSLTKSAPGSPTGRNSRILNSPRGLSLREVDLQIQSVLNLSSSEDEEEGEAEMKPHEPLDRRHRIRASIERSDYDDEVLFDNALRVPSIKPKSVVNRQFDRSSYRRSQTASAIPPVPQLPSRPQLNQRTSSMRWQSLLDEKSRGPPSRSQNASTTTADTSESSVDSAGESSANGNTPPSSQSPPVTRFGSSERTNVNTPLRRGSKLMSVTSEEETLLEAMREKRASIRANDFQKGFNSAMQMHVADYINRPKTSGADGRTSRGSIYGAGSSRGSISPPILGPTVYRPPGVLHHQQQQQQAGGGHLIGHVYKASLGAHSGLSASTDNLTLEDSYPFPEIPSEPIPLTITRSPIFKSEDFSPSLTFSSSDIMLPSSPSTRNSPLTPPPPGLAMGSLMGAYGVVRTPTGTMTAAAISAAAGDDISSPPRAQQLEVKSSGSRYGHERRETGSSSVVMLDGVESYAAKLDEENEISGWAVDSGMDRW